MIILLGAIGNKLEITDELIRNASFGVMRKEFVGIVSHLVEVFETQTKKFEFC